jgi:trehalose synthase
LLQVSRFDRFKDPLGVIEAYRLVRKGLECQLVLAGGGAPDDPEGAEVLRKVKEKADDNPDIHVLDLPSESNIEINTLQRGAQVIIQKSTKEGFGLTVTEALWKGVPVVGGAVGGIKLQIVDNKTGYLVTSVEETARRVKYLLENPDIAKRMGERKFSYYQASQRLSKVNPGGQRV